LTSIPASIERRDVLVVAFAVAHNPDDLFLLLNGRLISSSMPITTTARAALVHFPGAGSSRARHASTSTSSSFAEPSSSSSSTHSYPFPTHARPTAHRIFHLSPGASQAEVKAPCAYPVPSLLSSLHTDVPTFWQTMTSFSLTTPTQPTAPILPLTSGTRASSPSAPRTTSSAAGTRPCTLRAQYIQRASTATKDVQAAFIDSVRMQATVDFTAVTVEYDIFLKVTIPRRRDDLTRC
jgi:hypothetical protein